MMWKLVALSCLALTVGCAVPSVDVMPRYGTLDVDGSFGVQDTSGGGTLTRADLSTAGFQKDDSVLGLRADLDFGAPRVMLSGQSSNHDGSGTLSATLTDSNGNTIVAGTPVDSKLDLGLYQGVVTWDLGSNTAAVDSITGGTDTDTFPGLVDNLDTLRPGDNADGYYQEFNLELLERDQSTLREIDEALGRIEGGTFGLCESCEENISRERLRAVPHARKCIACQREAERNS